MRSLILICLTVLLASSADAQVGGSLKLERDRGAHWLRPPARRALLGYGALGLGAGLVLSAGLLVRVAERPGALGVVLALPAVTLAGSAGFAYLTYQRQERRERERTSNETLSLSARPMLGRDHIGLSATGRF